MDAFQDFKEGQMLRKGPVAGDVARLKEHYLMYLALVNMEALYETRDTIR